MNSITCTRRKRKISKKSNSSWYDSKLLLYKKRKTYNLLLKDDDKNCWLVWSKCCSVFFFLSLINTLCYKYPLNFICYILLHSPKNICSMLGRKSKTISLLPHLPFLLSLPSVDDGNSRIILCHKNSLLHCVGIFILYCSFESIINFSFTSSPFINIIVMAPRVI